MNGLSFLLTDLEISFEDALPTCGVTVCVCGIPYYSLAHFPYFLSTHTDWTPLLPLLFARLLGQGTHAHPSWSGCQNICRTVSVVKIFSTGCTQWAEGRRGGNSIGIVCGLSADKWASDAHPYGRPVSQPRRRLKGPQKIMWCLTAAT